MNIQPVSPGLFTHPDFDDHEMVCFASDQRTGLKAIIAVHDTTLGPALGGCRRWRYASEAEAVRDVLRLSRGMTLKNAAAGLDLGGESRSSCPTARMRRRSSGARSPRR